MKKALLAVASVGLLGMPLASQSVSFGKSEDAIKYRQSNFSVMATHFSDIGAMVKGDKAFDAKAAQANADVVVMLSGLPWAAFGPGTEGGKAKPAVWKEMDKVRSGAQDLARAATASAQLDNVKRAFAATQRTCKSCHDSYKDK